MLVFRKCNVKTSCQPKCNSYTYTHESYETDSKMYWIYSRPSFFINKGHIIYNVGS